ncbi:DUF1080 domain-containing protein [candidate division KSB1 bacterium]|nr:DUF1080 domain-containing protein [candidate division KSB1 bacterium]
MIKNRLLCLFFLLGAGCATVQQAKVSPPQRPVVALQETLALLPAQNRAQERLIIQEIACHGESGIHEICTDLASPDSITSTRAHYALHGLVHLAAMDKSYAESLSRSILNALDTNLPITHKAFLLEQLRQFAGRQVLPEVGVYLTHPQLCDPSARIFATIGGSEAGEILLAVLSKTSGPQQLSIINALAQLKYIPACPVLVNIYKEKKPGNTENILFALAETGCETAESLLLEAANKDSAAVDDLVRYAERRAQSGHADKCVEICRFIIHGEFPDFQRLAAMDVLLATAGREALPDLLPFIQSEKTKLRQSTLYHLENIDSTGLLIDWEKILRDAGPVAKADILAMFGRQSDTNRLPLIQEAMADTAVGVRCAALFATARIAPDRAVESVLRLKSDAAEQELETAKTVLTSLPHKELLPHILGPVHMPDNVKILLTDFLASRCEKQAVPFFLSVLDSENETLRISGFKALAETADREQLDALLDYLKYERNPSENRALQSAVVNIIRRAEDQNACLQKLAALYQQSPDPSKRKIFGIFKNIGNGQALKYVLAESKPDSHMQDDAIRALADWPNESAAEPLFLIAEQHENLKYRVLAIRGLVQLFDQNEMGQIRALEYLHRLMNATERPEEQRIVLSRFSRLKTPAALKIVAGYLDDREINYDAYTAAVKMVSGEDDMTGKIPAPRMIRAMIEAQADVTLLSQITEHPIADEKNNQPPEGFTTLFNGVDLTGWKGLVEDPVKRAVMTPGEMEVAQAEADRLMRDHWRVVDGVLYFDGKGASLCTEKEYRDFEVLVDWKIEKGGDSGIYLRGAPQVQIWDAVQRDVGSGGLYNNQNFPDKPLITADLPAGSWNHFRIIMSGEKVTVYLNDKLVVDNVIMENYWERDKPIYPSGAIELQAHNSPLYFRNVFIKELDPQPPLFKGVLLQENSLDGWQIVGGPQDSWKVENGVLYTNGKGGGWISTEREFTDFRLELEFRLPPNGNSGVFIRAPHSGDPAYTGMEIQVLDDYGEEYTQLQPWQYTGSIYGVAAPVERATKPAGEWQKIAVECLGSHVQVFVNEKRIIDADLVDFMYQLPTHSGLKRRTGFIGLQNHSTRVEYRNIVLYEL